MIYATPATGLVGLLVLFALILGGVRIGAALGLVGLGGWPWCWGRRRP
jgi:hypothetical protein